MSDEQTRRVSSSVEAGYEDLTIDELARRYENHRASLNRLVPVPWCETHDSKMLEGPMCQKAFYGDTRLGCVLQDPPKVWRETDDT
jgi:hypothetical protein